MWKILLSILSLFGSSRNRNDEENTLFKATPYGPQSMSQAQLAHFALHGGHDEMLKNPNGVFTNLAASADINGVNLCDVEVKCDSLACMSTEDLSAVVDPYEAGIKDFNTRWPGYPGIGQIAYTIDGSLEPIKELIEEAMDQYHNHTCIRFVPKTNEKDFVRIIHGVGCFSFVGRVGGLQVLSLGRGCDYLGTIVHELGHAIGLYHEHQRSDRDEHITVFSDNIRRGQGHNFQKTDPSEEMILSDYDPQSVMHYGEFAFSKSPGVLKTMQANDGRPLVEPYDKLGLNENDIRLVNELYKCQ